MHWRKHPAKGLLWFVASLGLTWIWLTVTGALGVDYLDAGMNWTFAWLFFGFGILAFFEGWPFAGLVRQPWEGILSALIAWVVSPLAWMLASNRLGTDGANALFSYAEFFLFTIAWFYHNEPFARLSQPTKGISLFALSGALGFAVYVILGPRDWEYLYYLPQWYFYFFLDWPICRDKPHYKGTFWAILIVIGTFVTHFIFNALGVPIASARGADFFSLLFIGMLLFYALEGWPFASHPQPAQGTLLIIASISVAVGAYPVLFNILKLDDYAMTAWSSSAWCWLAVIAWMMHPWPFESPD